jgi:hypothetical protein
VLDMTADPATLGPEIRDGTSLLMKFSLLQRKTLFGLVFLIAFSVFVADVIDLREELRLLSSPFNCLDNTIEAGVVSSFSIEPEPFRPGFAITNKASVEISFLHLLPYAFRAPPLAPKIS